MKKVWFVGAGPGDPELITVKGRDLIAKADAIIFAGSLVQEAATRWAKPGCIIADSKGMTLDEITEWLIGQATNDKVVIRLQTGDPGLYGALVEMLQPLDAANVQSEVVPGVSSAMASMAAASETLTLPEVTQTVILTRVEGRTPMPSGESLYELALHHCTLCLFLSITLLKKISSELIRAGWPDDSPILIVHKASWHGQEKILRCTLSTMRQRCIEEGINSQAMIVASPTLGARTRSGLIKSKLYDPSFSHKFRRTNSSAKDKQ